MLIQRRKGSLLVEVEEPPERTVKEGTLESFVEDWRHVKIENLSLTRDQTNEFISLIKEKKDDIITLSLRNTLVDGGFEIVKDALKELEQLIKLDLSSTEMGPDEMELLIEILLDGALMVETLVLHNNPLDDEGTSILTVGLSRHRQLRNLDISRCRIGDDGADSIFEYLSENTTLRELNLSFNELKQEGWRYIGSALKVNSTLLKLTITSNKIDDESIRIICNGVIQNKNLATLDVRYNEIGDIGADALYEAIVKSSSLYSVSVVPGNKMAESVSNNLEKLIRMKMS